ncbi:hypothetical protein DDD64_06765 [Actinotignum sanguinis]|uniref:hypothetical protein n=1 Tax=Actinotignum sanguinis TaxID=1445614 RepID=UPI000F7D9071|nr:hypothetical protein [Actinotignum sanguinis]MDY5148342.1 hypothetical protein [Actinotignum sanguinis]RTE48453.1 hypothetical protein DDD64_06765 [Actinotignum sanguinis]
MRKLFYSKDWLRVYVVTLVSTCLMSGLFFIWMYVKNKGQFSTLMADYGSDLIAYCLMLVIVLPLVFALHAKRRQDQRR